MLSGTLDSTALYPTYRRFEVAASPNVTKEREQPED
jgi:hypothetical protein